MKRMLNLLGIMAFSLSALAQPVISGQTTAKIAKLGLEIAVAELTVPQPIQVFLFEGQSNAAGNGATNTLPAELHEQADILYSYWVNGVEDGWGPLRCQLNASGNPYYGAEMTLGRALADSAESNVKIAIIKYARNGTPLYNNGNPDKCWNVMLDDSLYYQSRDFVLDRLNELRDMGYDPYIAGIVWVQGEGDCANLERAVAYEVNFTNLIEFWRADLPNNADVGELPIFPGLVNPLNEAYPNVAEWQTSVFNVAAADDLVTPVLMADLELKDDLTHLTPAAYQILGTRFANEIIASGVVR